MSELAAWIEDAENHDTREWEGEVARWSKALYVGQHSEKDRRSIHGEAVRSLKAARRFWEQIPNDLRLKVADEAGLSHDAIPSDLRAA